jgi:N-acetylglucosaminylphosphatidylinositol deacetylase
MWPSDAVARQIFSAYRANESDFDIVITFDNYGISGHQNHRSLYHGAKAFLKSIPSEHRSAMYYLPTVNLARKYTSILDVVPSILATILRSRTGDGGYPSRLFFMSGPAEYRRNQLAMISAHKTQMLWFRWGWILFSRYMVVNELVRETDFS